MKSISALLGLLLLPISATHAGRIDIFPGGGGGGEPDPIPLEIFPGNWLMNQDLPGTPIPLGESQLMLELINRARANPAAEAARLGIDLNEGLPPATISSEPAPPLAVHASLRAAADYHTYWMITSGTLSHVNIYGDLQSRVITMSYFPGASFGVEENIGKLPTGETDLAAAVTKQHELFFRDPDSRRKMLDASYDETGVSLAASGGFPANGAPIPEIRTSAIFGFNSNSSTPEGPYVLGVAYQDKNANGSYDLGEGLPNVSVRLAPGGASGTTDGGGGYSIPRGRLTGRVKATFSGSGIQQTTVVKGEAERNRNLKIDLKVAPVTTPDASVTVMGNLQFGDVAVGTMVSLPVTITNTGNMPVKFTAFSQGDRFGGIVTTPLAVGASQTISVIFSPLAAQTYSGTFSLATEGSLGTISIPQSGRGVVLPILEAPRATPNGGRFTNSVRVKIVSPDKRGTIRYTTDGNSPTEESRKYTGPIVLKETTTLKIRVFRKGYVQSPVTTVKFTKD